MPVPQVLGRAVPAGRIVMLGRSTDEGGSWSRQTWSGRRDRAFLGPMCHG